MNSTASERTAHTAAERTLDTLKYFFEAPLDDARMVLRTAQAIVRDRENGGGEKSPTRQPKQPAARSQQSTPLTEAQVREIRRRYQPGEAASALARKYGRARTTIHDIACRRSWKEFPPAPGEYGQDAPPAPEAADAERPESGWAQPAIVREDKPPQSAPPPPESPAPANATDTTPSPPPTAAPPDRNKPATPPRADTEASADGDNATRRTPETKRTTPPDEAPRPDEAQPRSDNPRTKLTEAQVREIRRRYQAGASTALAPQYGVDARTIRTIACRGSWKHLPPEPGEYLQADPPPAETSAPTPATKPTPASLAERAPRPAAATTPKKSDPAAPAPANVSTGAGAAPSTKPPKTTATRHRTDVDARRKRTGRATKLTEAQVREIRRAYRPGGATKALAKKYGVSTANILSIAQRHTWNHLKPMPGEYIPPANKEKPAAGPEHPPPPRRHVAPRTTRTEATPAATATSKANGTRQINHTNARSRPIAPHIAAEKKRLTPDSIRSIRERAADDVPPRRIARDFGISEETVRALAG